MVKSSSSEFRTANSNRDIKNNDGHWQNEAKINRMVSSNHGKGSV